MHPELARSRALDRRPDRRHLRDLVIRERLRRGTRRVQHLRQVRGLGALIPDKTRARSRTLTLRPLGGLHPVALRRRPAARSVSPPGSIRRKLQPRRP